jgi:hypothetical protein
MTWEAAPTGEGGRQRDDGAALVGGDHKTFRWTVFPTIGLTMKLLFWVGFARSRHVALLARASMARWVVGGLLRRTGPGCALRRDICPRDRSLILLRSARCRRAGRLWRSRFHIVVRTARCARWSTSGTGPGAHGEEGSRFRVQASGLKRVSKESAGLFVRRGRRHDAHHAARTS